MSIKPEKLKQYLSLKEAAITLRPNFTVTCNDPKPDSRTASVSVLTRAPFLLEGKAKTVIATLHSFSDTVVVAASSRLKPELVRFTFGVNDMRKEE